MDDQLRDGRQGGWFWLDNAVIDRYGPLIGVYGVAVYALLVRKSDARGVAFPSYNWIAGHLGASRRQVVETVRLLEQHGLIRIRTIRPKGKRPHNEYLIVTIGASPALVQDVHQSIGAPDALVHEVPVIGAGGAPEMVQEVHPINTHYQDPDIKTQGGGGARGRTSAHPRTGTREGSPPAPMRELIEIPDPFPARWIPEFASEHGLKVAWTEAAAYRYVLHYAGTGTRRSMEEWTAKCQKWILEDHEKSRTAGTTRLR